MAIRATNLFGSGVQEDYLRENYDRIFTNFNFSQLNMPKDRIKIAVLCFSHGQDFTPQEVINGQKYSGSEEALIYASAVLAKKNHRVTVYANITEKQAVSLK